MVEFPPARMEYEPHDRAQEIMDAEGLQPNEPIPLEAARNLLHTRQHELAEGLRRNFYHAIKSSLFHNRMQAVQGPLYVLRRRKVLEEEKNHVDFVWFMERNPATKHNVFPRAEEYKAVFTFSADLKRILGEEERMTTDTFTGYDTLAFERMTDGTIDLRELDDKRRASATSEEKPLPEDAYVPYETMRVFLESALKPPEVFDQANERIDRIWSEHNFPAEDARKLKQAIAEFGNHQFRIRDGFEMIGACLVVPYDFEQFVRRRFGISLRHCELTGARRMREEYSPEERAELAAARHSSWVHEASVYMDAVVIDWTSRQIKKDASVPEIIDLDKDEKLRARIEIYQSER